MKIKYVPCYSDITGLIDGPYNPPDDMNADTFELEYNKFRGLLIAMLLKYGKSDPRGHGDYSVGHYTGMSRGVGIALSNKRLFSHELIESIKSVVDAFEVGYVVVVNAEYKIGDDVYVCITKDAIAQGHAQKSRWLKPFGEIIN